MVFLLDNGHGGVTKEGVYTTCPNWKKDDPSTWHKMWVHDDVPIYEGEFNRLLVDEIFKQSRDYDFDLVNLVPEVEDVSLRERVNRANSYYETITKDCIFVSIHGNAFNTSATGIEVFTSKGETESDPIAEVIAISLGKWFPSQAMRWDLSDGDKDKEANFYVLKNTDCPAVLTENLFFDNPSDAEIMMSEEGVVKLAKAYVEAFNKIYHAKHKI